MAGSPLVRVVVIDDMTDTRTTLAEFLDETPGVDVVATAADQVAAVDVVRSTQPDLIVLDLEFVAGMSGVELLPELLRDCPTARVVALSAHGRTHEQQALAAGAYVYFPEESMREIVESVRAVIDDIRTGRLG